MCMLHDTQSKVKGFWALYDQVVVAATVGVPQLEVVK